MLNVNNFVDVNIQVKKSVGLPGTYDTMVYLAPIPEGTTYTKAFYSVNTYDGDDKNIKLFFENGGQYVIVYNAPLSADNEMTNEAKVMALINDIKSIEGYNYDAHKFVYLCLAYERNSDDLETLVKGASTLKSPNKVRIIATLKYDAINNTELETYFDSEASFKLQDYDDVVVQLTKDNAEIYTYGVLVGAYATQIDLNKTNSIRDYCFYKFSGSSTYTTSNNVNTDDDDIIGMTNEDFVIYKGVVNSVENVANNIINVGGNLTNGVSVHIDFATLCLENDCVQTLWNALVERQYLTQGGLDICTNRIKSLITRYIDNGFIQTNAYYNEENLTTTYNGKTYTIISTGRLLQTGYLVYSIPMANISIADKASRKFTPIFVVIITQDGARMISLDGNVYA